MVNNDDRSSLLAKMAKFVRNPTKDWSELNQPEKPQESGYDKQALKAMIERIRQKNFNYLIHALMLSVAKLSEIGILPATYKPQG